MADTYQTVTDADGFTVSSNMETAEAMRTNFGIDAPPTVPDTPVADPPPASDPDEPEKPAAAAKVETPDVKADDARERNPDGTFKAAPATAKPRNRRDDPQVAVQAAITKQREAERRADAAEARARDLEGRLSAPTPATRVDDPPAAKPPTVAEWRRYAALPGAPKLTDTNPDGTPVFASVEEHTAAMALFIADQRYDEREAKTRERQAEESRATEWRGRLAAARKRMPDFDSRVNPELPMSTPEQDLIKESDIGPDILVHLSKPENLEYAQRLSTLHPIQLIRELGKLEARLEAASPPTGPAPAPLVSQAKPPITPVTASPSVSDADQGSDDEPFDRHFERENRRERTVARRA